MNSAAGIGVREDDEERDVIFRVGDGIYVLLERGVEMQLAGAHASYYGVAR